MKKFVKVSIWTFVLSGLFAPSRAYAAYVNTYTDGDGIVWHMAANSGEQPEFEPYHVTRQGVVHITEMVLKEKHKSVVIPRMLQWDSGGNGGTASPTVEYMTTGSTANHPWLESVGVNDLVMFKIPCFKNCPVLKSFKMDTLNPVNGRYAVESGVLFSKDFTSLKKYPEGKEGEEYSVPSAVTELKDSCFANTKLCRIRFLGNAPQTVADNVFSGSDSLAYVYYSQGASGWSSTFKGKPAYAMPKAVTGVSASQGTSASAITITWSENAVATNYKIYRSESTSGSKILLGTVSGSTLYSDTSASADRKYYYTVVAVNGPVTGESSATATGWLKGVTYTITYRPGSSGSGSVLTQSKPHGTSVTLKGATYTRSGYTQTGWATSDGGSQVYALGGTCSVNDSITLYPVWTAVPTTYTVGFNANGGTGTMTSQTITYGVSTALKANTFTKSGYTFAGWSKTAGGSVAYANGASVSNLASAGGSIMLYAVWTAVPDTYTVVFDGDADDGDVDPLVGVYGTMENQIIRCGVRTPLSPNGFDRRGGAFVGWSRTLGGPAEFADQASVLDLAEKGGSITLYAVWDCFYTVIFNANGGSGVMANQSIWWDTNYYISGNPGTTLRGNEFTKSGYQFAGWARTPDGAVAYSDCGKVYNIASPGKTVTLYAVWTMAPTTYTVVFNANGGSGTMTSQTITYGVSTSLNANTFTKSGYTFAGWSKTAGGSVAYANGASVSNLASAGGSITLYAVWTPQVVAPSAPTGVSATDGSYADYARVTWSAASGATSYNLYRSTTTSRPSTATKTGVTSPYNDTTATPGTKYYYWIAAVNSAGSSVSSYDTGYRAVSLTLGKSSDAYASTGGSGSVSVTANTSWSASANASWITLGTKSGSGNGTLTYTIAANASTSSRSGTITVTAGSGTSYPAAKTITVSQGAAGSDFVVDNGVLTKYTGSGGSVTIPSGVISIGNQVFRGRSSLTSVTIPSSVTSIGYQAFYDCSGLTSVTIPSSVTSIDGGAFSGCSSLTSVTIPPGVTTIGNYVFHGCSALATVTIPSSVTSIGYEAFSDCSSLTSVTIPSGVTTIGAYAFEYCSSLTSVTIPSSVTSIDGGAFSGCSSLTSINVDSANRYYCSIEGVLYNKSATELICCPGGAKAVTIPSSVTSIGYRAFLNCDSLASVTIPSGVTRIGSEAFGSCRELTSINVDSANGSYCSIDGVLYNKDATMLIRCPNGAKAVTIPSGVTTIGAYAFEGCSSLTLVAIPSSVTIIGNEAFNSCRGLTSVTMSSSVTSIGAWAFSNCSSLKVVCVSDNGDIATLKQKLSQSGLSVDNVVFTHVDYYSVSFNANGGEGSMTSQNMTYGVSTALKGNSFTYSGYVFAGWATTADGPVAYADNASVLNLALPESSVTLYAVWEKLVVPAPSVSPADGATFSTDSCLVTLDCAMEGAAIYYTTNGATPKTSASYLYTQPFEIRGTVNVKAVAVKDGVKSDYVTATITKVDPVPVETPVITPVNGTTFSTDSCEVTIACPTDGATIYYTTDGTLPTVSESCRYKGAFNITDTATIKAIAVKEGWLESACASATITKVGLTLEGVLGVDSRVRVTTGGEADWVPVNDANAKEGGTSARSGLGNTDDDSVSWIQLSVNGKGTLSFWCKTSCEHDDDNAYTWDRVEVTVDGQAKPDWYMDGTSQWVQRTIVFDTVAEHTIRIAYVKDESDFNGEDCAWIDEVKWEPETAGGAVIADVTALKEAFGEESSVVRNLTSEEELVKFNEFLGKCGITAASQISDKQKQYAYESFRMSAITVEPQLFENEPKLKILEFKQGEGGWSVSISLKVGEDEIAMARKALEEHISVGNKLTEITAKPDIVARPSEDGSSLTFTIAPPEGKQAFIMVR